MAGAESDIKSKVDQIIQERHELLPEIGREVTATAACAERVEALLALLVELRSIETDEDSKQRIERTSADLAKAREALRRREEALAGLRARFSRETVNIGVSGEARVGKSTTLQRISGLTDTQIPTGSGLPVTAVRSEIFNSTDEHADVTFRDQASFLSGYIRPLLNVVNERLDTPIVVDTVATFKDIQLPESLGDNVDSAAADSLKRLNEAQRSYSSYAGYLTGDTRRVALADLRKFVAYPTNDEMRTEGVGREPASRAYIAVRAVKIYCPFPSLPGVRIGLVDLPGLGEIGASVADLHLSGLEDGVDQIVPIMRPTESEGFVKQGIASNIDHLRRIQRGIKRRADLITAAINVYDGLDRTAESLADDFQRSINGAQKSDKIDILTYTAVEDASVANLLSHLLAKTADRLPSMDQEVLQYALSEHEDETSVSAALQEVDRTMNELLRRIPLPDKVLNRQIDRVLRPIVDDYNRYEVDLAAAVETTSEWYEEFDKSVATIHERTRQAVASGFFLGEDDWQSTARGQADYYNWYRDEAKRLRREIIAQYSHLDSFYDDHVAEFKLKVIQILLDNTGGLEKKFRLLDTDDPDTRIDKIATQLAGTIPDEDLESALALLKSVQFSFRNNVFLQISKHLEPLSNPPESAPNGKMVQVQRGYSVTTEPEYDNVRQVLGDLGDVSIKVERLSTYLTHIASKANDEIQEALLKHDDRFHEYLSVSISFFIDHLYRKDFENFKHGVVRGLINNYRDLVLPGQSLVAVDGHKIDLIGRVRQLSDELQSGVTPVSVPMGGTSQVRRPEGASTRTAPQVGQRIMGTVKASRPFGIFVDVGLGRDGLIPARFLNDDAPNPGEAIDVEIQDVDEQGKITLWPIRS